MHTTTRRFHHSCAILALSTAATTATAATFVAANLFDNPDTLYTWDSTGALIYQPSGVTLSGDFILGMHLTDLNNGYYISAYTDTGQTTTGIYKITNGFQARLRALPFQSPAYAGLIPNAAGDALMTIVDQNWLSTAVPYRMYKVDFAGVFTQLMDITTPGISNPEIKGLCRNPLTGILYAYEQTTNVLLTINESTGVSNTVGALGVDAFGAGGMAFSPDGAELVLATGNDFEYHIDPQTGHATPIGTFVSDPSRPECLVSIPEPAPAFALLTGFAGLVRFRGRSS